MQPEVFIKTHLYKALKYDEYIYLLVSYVSFDGDV